MCAWMASCGLRSACWREKRKVGYRRGCQQRPGYFHRETGEQGGDMGRGRLNELTRATLFARPRPPSPPTRTHYNEPAHSHTMYTPQEPFQTGFLKVSDLHSL